jgi:hypothetical protein
MYFTEKARNLDNLTPLDARNSLLMDPQEYKSSAAPYRNSRGYESVPLSEHPTTYSDRPYVDVPPQQHLLADVPSVGRSPSRDSSYRDHSPPGDRVPRLPEIDLGAPTGYNSGTYAQQGGGAYRGHAY